MTGRVRSAWRFLPPSGPVISLLLIGLVLLSSLLYYRAVKIQRFLEPALALSQPRNEFTKHISKAFHEAFGQKDIEGVRIKAGTIQLDSTRLFSDRGALTPWGKTVLRKLGRVFLALLGDDRVRSEIDSILVVGRYPAAGMPVERVRERMDVQLTASFVHETLLHAEPKLARNYAPFFAAGAQPAAGRDGAANRVDFIIVPSEYLHIEVLERLEKYTH